MEEPEPVKRDRLRLCNSASMAEQFFKLLTYLRMLRRDTRMWKGPSTTASRGPSRMMSWAAREGSTSRSFYVLCIQIQYIEFGSGSRMLAQFGSGSRVRL